MKMELSSLELKLIQVSLHNLHKLIGFTEGSAARELQQRIDSQLRAQGEKSSESCQVYCSDVTRGKDGDGIEHGSLIISATKDPSVIHNLDLYAGNNMKNPETGDFIPKGNYIITIRFTHPFIANTDG